MLARPRVVGTFIVVGILISAVLATLGILGSISVHRSPIVIADADEPEVPQDYDALLVRGWLDGDVYVVTLVVAGVVQDSRYNVGIFVRGVDQPDWRSVYDLVYQSGVEAKYGTPTERSGDSLTFRFALSHLGPAAYVVGLDANVWGPIGEDSFDTVNEGPPAAMSIPRLLALPVSPVLLFLGAAAVAIPTLIAGLNAIRRTRSTPRRDF